MRSLVSPFLLQLSFEEDLRISSMFSGEGECVPFSNKLYPSGNVEDWLLEVENTMRGSLREILNKAILAYVEVFKGCIDSVIRILFLLQGEYLGLLFCCCLFVALFISLFLVEIKSSSGNLRRRILRESLVDYSDQSQQKRTAQMNQSEFLAITCNHLKAREKSCVQGEIGFSFVCHWMKDWREILKLIVKRSDRKRVITVESHLRIAVPVTS